MKVHGSQSPERKRLSRWYVFSVITLSSFLVILTCWRVPSGQFRAQSVITFQNPNTDPGGVPMDSARAMFVQKTVKDFNEQLQCTMQVDSCGGSEQQYCDVPWSIAQKTDPGTGRGVINVEYRSNVRKTALEKADSVASQYVEFAKERLKTAWDGSPAARGKSLVSRRREAQRVQQKLDEFLLAHFQGLEDEAQKWSARADSTMSETGAPLPTSEPAPVRQNRFQQELNPSWVVLKTRIDEMQRQLTAMLRDYNDSHPLVRSKMDELDGLKLRVAELPQYLEKPVETQAVLAVPFRATGAAQEPDFDRLLRPAEKTERQLQQTKETVARFHLLRSNRDKSWYDFQESVQVAEKLAAKKTSFLVSEEPVFSIRWARIVESKQEFHLWRLTFSALAAISLGVLSFLVFPPARSTDKLFEASEVVSLLPMPVVGMITSTSLLQESAPRRNRHVNSCVRWATRVSEFVLAFFVFSFIFSAHVDNQFTSQYLSDPAGTFVQAVHNAN
ncbi:MAG: hypothetical protein CMJ81_15320 [Planctomycetaceae bacterium]|nr:hypothetical protein [Planctomycetaceae bacterium]